MKKLIVPSVLGLVVILFAQVPTPIVTVGPGFAMVDNGDTNHYSAWTPSDSGGNFNGGRVFGLCGDCQPPIAVNPTNANRHVMVRELKTYDPFSAANTTIPIINSMDDYGTAGDRGCYSVVNVNRAMSPGLNIWSWNGNLMLFIQCQYTGQPYSTYSNTLITSPDFGQHWCNYAHYTGNGNVCNSGAPWSATGDLPRSNTSQDIQWPADLYSETQSYMGKSTLVQISQDGAARPTIPRVDTSYEYFISNQGTGGGGGTVHKLFAHRFKLADDPMLPASWQHWNGSSYQSELSAVADIMPRAWCCNGSFSQTAMYSPDFKKFFLIVDDGHPDSVYPMAYALKPEGPWIVMPKPRTPSSSYGYQFTTFMLSTYKSLGNDEFTVSVSTNGSSEDTQNPPWGYTVGFQGLSFAWSNSVGGRR
jgi:hypothetical protein